MFAIVQSGGKQYRVSEGDILRFEALDAEPGDVVELPVLLLGGGDVRVGTPLVEGASVKAEVLGHGRGDKSQVYKYKAKVNYRRKIGHRQPYTEVRMVEIRGPAEGRKTRQAEVPVEGSPVEDEVPTEVVEVAGA